MEPLTTATPPPPILEGHARSADASLFWLRPAPFDVRIDASRGDLKLLAVASGTLGVRQRQRRAELGPGQFGWVDVRYPFELRTSGARLLFLLVPRARLRRSHPGLDLATATARGEAHAGDRIFGQLAASVALEGRTLDARARDAALAALIGTLGVCAPRSEIDLPARRIERATRYLALHLGRADLSPEEIASAQGVSRRYLDRILLDRIGETLSGRTRRLRMERAAQALASDPGAPIAPIGEACGYPDPSHFTRAFRRWHGCTPSAFAAGQRRGDLPGSAREARALPSAPHDGPLEARPDEAIPPREAPREIDARSGGA